MKAKEDQFQAINSNPVLSVGNDGTVLYSNKAGEPLLHEWGVVVGGKLPSSIVDIVQRVIFQSNPEKIEVKVGKNVYLVVFHFFPEQEYVNVSGFDISDQKETKEKPLDNEEKYQELFNLIEQSVQICEIVFDKNGQPVDNIILDVNLAYEKHSDLRREQVIGRSFKEIFPIVEQTWLDRYGEVVRTGMGMHFEEYNASLDKWFEVFASPMGGSRFIAIFSDITKRKQTEESLLQSEQHYRLLHETMLQGVVYQDAIGKVISMNPAAERILGKTPAEFLGSSSVDEEYLTIREDGSPFPGLEHPAMVSLRTGRKVQDIVMGVYNPRENGYRWININAVPIFRTGENRPFQVYTLFDDITERKQEENRMLRYNRILEGINKIFSNVVQAKTEEELGNACLSVALEITCSQVGFINEMDNDGLLHDIAKSELAWEQCFMYDKTGHRRSPSEFIVHGLYGSVIINEKSFFTNDPLSHPDSIGVPSGHPPLTSFLGVPLVQNGKTVGLIAVANRENGYSCEQLEDLEAIAPAVMQVLQRKREEQERMKAEEALGRERSLLKSIMQTTDVMLVLLDPQFNFLWVNSAYAKTCHMKPWEMVGKNHFALYPNAENEEIFRTVRDTGRGIFYKDKQFVFPDQPERGVTYWDWSLAPVKDSCGDVKSLVFSLRETTKYKQVEEALRESEERLRLLGDNLPNSVIYQYAYEPDGSVRFLYLSTGIERLNGVNVQDVLRDPNTLYRQVPPEYLERVFEAEARSVRELSDFDMELPMQLPNGLVRWMRLHSRPRRLPNGRTIWNGVQTDITKHKQAEEALRKSEEHYRMLFTNMTEGFALTEIIYDKNGRPYDYRYLEINPAYELNHGVKKEELLGKTLLEAFPNTTTTTIEKFGEVALSGQSTNFEIFSQVLNKYIDIYAFSPEKGKLAAIIRDVTARKEAEARLKETLDNLENLVKERTAELETFYNSLKESEISLAEAQKMAHIGNWDWNLITGETYWSDELYRIFGRNPHESGATYYELLNYIHPEDRGYVDNAIKKALYEKPLGIDYGIILDNGEERTVHAQSEVIFDEKNIPVRAKGIVQDITERKKSEEKIQNLANIVESSSDAIGTMSLDGVIASWNKGAEQVYGYSAEEILGKNGSILSPPHLSEETKKLTERIKKGERIHNYETSRLRKDGTIINVSITFSPVFDASGKLTAISVISRDITDSKKAEEKLRESEEKYRNIVETANEGILIINDESIITYANKKMTDMLGYTLEEGIGRPVWDFADEEGKTILKQNLKKRLQGINESYELRLICKDGSSLWTLINAKSLFDKDGKFMGAISMLTDITERKMAEEALERMDKVRIKEIHHRIKNNLQIISSLLDLQAEKFEDENVVEAFREGQNRVISMSLIHEELYKGEGTDTLDFSAYLKKLAKNLLQTYSLSSKNISLSMDLEEDTFLDMDTAVPLGIIVNELVSNSLKHAFTGKQDGKIRIKLCREEKNSEMNMSLFSLTISDNGRGFPEDLELECAESLGLQLVNILVDQLDGELELKRAQGTEFIIRFNVVEKVNLAQVGLKSQENR
ncbi:MAG TPA: PAS domain S-box protein [Methanosarcina sp.]|nr:PAS domain S-box protein [Methanosarcina sp.]